MQVVLIAAISLDGRITRPGETGAGFASPEDQEWFFGALREFDCSVMGRVTYDTIKDASGQTPDAGRRLRVVMTRQPVPDAGAGLATGASASAAAGNVSFTRATPAAVVASLAARGKRRCALLGGGQIYSAFLDAGLVDALWLTLEPVVLGAGGTLFADGPVRDGRCELAGMHMLSAHTLLLNYRPPGRPTIPFALS